MGLTSTNSRRSPLTRSVFRSNGTLYTCFILKAFLRRKRSRVDRLMVWMLGNVALSARILVLICRRVMALFAPTIFTITASCAAVNVRALPPRRGSLSVLQNTNTVSTLYSIDTVYSTIMQVQYWDIQARHKILRQGSESSLLFYEINFIPSKICNISTRPDASCWLQ